MEGVMTDIPEDVMKRLEYLEQRVQSLESRTMGLAQLGGPPIFDAALPVNLADIRFAVSGVVVKEIDGELVRYVDPEK